MRCYFWEEGEVRDGILVEREGSEWVIPLGKLPNTDYTHYLKLFSKNPPDLRREGKNAFIDDAFPVPITTDYGERIELAQPHDKHDDDDRILVQVSTYCSAQTVSMHALPGFWAPGEGNPDTLSYGVYTDRHGSQWLKGVVRLCPGEVLRVGMEGRANGDYALVNRVGELKSETWTRYQVRRV